MKRGSVLVVLLVVAIVGCNLLLGVITFHNDARSRVESSDPSYGTVELDSRKTMETGHVVTVRKARGLQNVRADDYQPVDPSPSSKARIRPGPIEDGTHLFPYVPPPVQSPDAPGED